MSFILNEAKAQVYAPGHFLAHEDCVRVTKTIPQEGSTAVGDGKYVPMGTVFPSNDEHAIGIVYEDVDVTSGDMPGSVVISGVVYENRLPDDLDSDAKTALIAAGFKFIEEGEVTRPDDESDADDNEGVGE